MESSDKNTVVIVGVGANTALGDSVEASMASVRAGIAAMQEHPYMIDHHGDPMLLSAAPYVDSELPAIDRMIEMGKTAAMQAIQPVINSNPKVPLEFILGLPELRPGLAENFEKEVEESIAKFIDLDYPVQATQALSGGHASGIMAMEVAYHMIQNDPKILCLVGGIDSYIQSDTLEWLDATEQLHSPNTIWGFCPGEAAGFTLLCSQQFADYFGLEYQAELLAIASASEENLIKTDTVCVGKGLSKAFKGVFKILDSTDEKISNTICDMNGEPYRADEYGFSVARTTHYFEDSADFMTPADCWGDIGAASGPMYAALNRLTISKNIKCPNNTLIWASSECGHRAAAILKNS